MTDLQQIFDLKTAAEFNKAAVEVFKYQAAHCALYGQFLHHLKTDVKKVSELSSIPFMPVAFFKSHTIKSGHLPDEIIFSSSATTGIVQSKHHVTDVSIYEKSYLKAFEHFYGPVNNYCILALLPAYQEREGSSLIYMVDDLIKKSGDERSGYFLHDNAALYETLKHLKETGKKTVLIGVTYALLDFIEAYRLDFPELIVMETGGMKGRRKEMVRAELHAALKSGFGVPAIHSEYGMTELLSQAYSDGDGIFHCPAWMKVLIRDVNDPFTYVNPNKTGGINVIDLANINSCAFIATQDLGRTLSEGSFEVLGRFDNSDIRGCNLLVQ